MLSHRKKLIQYYSQFEVFYNDWNTQVHTSNAYFNSIANIISRFSVLVQATKSGKGFGVLEQFQDMKDLLLGAHVQKLEEAMKAMHKYISTFENIKGRISQISLEETEYFRKNVTEPISELVESSERDVPLAELHLLLQVIPTMFEQEFWTKKNIVENISYDLGDSINSLFQTWTAESSIDHTTIKEVLRNTIPKKQLS